MSAAKAGDVKEFEGKWRTEKAEEDARFAWASLPPMVGKDKAIPKVQKFQNRLKKFTANDLAPLKKELSALDLGKYVEELSECLLESVTTGVFKLKDLPAAVELCAMLHVSYPDFSSSMEKALQKGWGQASFSKDLYSRRRVYCRLAGELALVKVMSDKLLLSFLQEVCGACEAERTAGDKAGAEEQVLSAFAILASVVQKQGLAIAGIASKTQREMEEMIGREWKRARVCVLSDATQQALGAALVSVLEHAAGAHLLQANRAVQEQDGVNTVLMIEKGSVDAENEARAARFREHLSGLEKHVQALAEALDKPMPDYKSGAQKREESVTTSFSTTAPSASSPNVLQASDLTPAEMEFIGGALHVDSQLSASASSGASQMPLGIVPDPTMKWVDDAERKFYEDLLDLKEVVPEKFLGLGKDRGGGNFPGGHSHSEGYMAPQERTVEVDTGKFEVFLDRLASCDRVGQLNEHAMTFAHDWSSKACRRRIATVLSRVKRIHSAYIPYHCRWLATVSPYFKELPAMVLKDLEKEKADLLPDRSPDATVKESKQRNIKFLGEMAKFRLAPPGVILDTFAQILDIFEVDLCCCLLENCGRYLLYTQETKLRFENLLERMMRLKNHKGLGIRDEMALDDAYYQLKPPENKKEDLAKQRAKRSEMERLVLWIANTYVYIAENVEDVVKMVMHLPWEHPEHRVEQWLKRGLLDLNLHADYEHLYCVATFLSGMSPYREDFVLDCVDALLEAIQLTLEKNDFRDHPLRVRQTKVLGEFYAYRLVDSQVIFDYLYQFLGWSGPSSYRAAHLTRLYDLIGHRILLSGEEWTKDAFWAGCAPGSISKNDSSKDAAGKGGKGKGKKGSKKNEPSPSGSGGGSKYEVDVTTKSANPNIDAVARAIRYFGKDYEKWSQFARTKVWTPELQGAALHPEHVGDDPQDYFRLKLICILLDTIGHYFVKGAAKVKMQRFVLFFRRYFACKADIPVRVANAVDDTLELLGEDSGATLLQLDTDILRTLRHDLDTVKLSSERAIEDAERQRAAEQQRGGGKADIDGGPQGSDDSSESEESDYETDSGSSGSASESDEEDTESEAGGEDSEFQQRLNVDPQKAMEQNMDDEIAAMMAESVDDVRRNRMAGGANAGVNNFMNATLPTQPSSTPTQTKPGFLEFKVMARGRAKQVQTIQVPEENKLSQSCMMNMSLKSVEESKKRHEEELLRQRTLQAARLVDMPDPATPRQAQYRQPQGRGGYHSSAGYHHAGGNYNQHHSGKAGGPPIPAAQDDAYLSSNILPEAPSQHGNVVYKQGRGGNQRRR
ncbi:unnamed protein product [Amoebophrya sp. A25]|nr:unnamed protein product [Amoebophrya sp. A25]|eukprot:GSA25T00001874001.1